MAWTGKEKGKVMRNSSTYLIIAILALLVLSGLSMAGDHAFVGAKKCKMCHMKEYKAWEATPMAMAFESLKPGVKAEAKTAAGLDADKDYTTDASCLACHVTGPGKDGGFVDFESTPTLAGVGCESCHGAGAGYIAKEFMTLKNKEYKLGDMVAVGLVEKVTADQCTTCHNADNPFAPEGFVFDFEGSMSGSHENFPLKYEH
jgi:hypothetical protein